MVSTSIPTLSIAAIISAKAQKHTEYYNTKHGKIASVWARPRPAVQTKSQTMPSSNNGRSCSLYSLPSA